MKFIGVLFFVGLICAASAKLPMANLYESFNSPPPTINDQFVRFLHGERINFTCGWPESGIPAIEPHNIEEFQTVITSDTEFSNIDFTLRNADVTGQHNMCFSFFDLSIAGLIMRFDLNIPTMNIVGTHSTSAQLIGIQAPVDGNGNFNMNVNNVQVTATAQLRNLPNGNLNMVHLVSSIRIGSAVAELTGFGALDRTISRMISAAAPGIVADNQDKINSEVQRVLIPGLNRFLNNHNINSLVNLMASRTQNPPPRSCFGVNPRICPV